LETKISASILNADLLHLEDVIHKLETAGADMLHFDVMDGVFVNNISFGVPVLNALSGITSLYKDVHLMITDPLKYVEAFAKAGAELITFHLESESDPDATIDAIHAAGCKAGISVKPATPAEAVLPFLDRVELVLVMTVEPGFGGQGYIHYMTKKVETLRDAINASGREIMLQVDGGINAETAPIASGAGADVLVVGSYLFKQEDVQATMDGLRSFAAQAQQACV